MVEIKAIIRLDRLEDVLHAIRQVPGSAGVTVSKVEGFGREQPPRPETGGFGRVLMAKVETVVPRETAPSIIAGKLTLGSLQQILNAFTQVRNAFQYLINSWSTIVDLISIYQRLRGFEAMIAGAPLPEIETRTEAQGA